MRVPRWRLIVSIALSCGVLILAILQREQIWSAILNLRAANPGLLALAALTEVSSFFCASLIYWRATRSLGYRFGLLRLWATVLVAIVVSQSVPAGGVASYAFLIQVFRRQGVPASHAALLASLEALSYAGAMLLMFGFSLGYLALASGAGAASPASLLAGAVALVVIGLAAFVLTRDPAVLARWLVGLKNAAARVLRRRWSDEPIQRMADELARGRALVVARRGDLALLVLIQIVALIGHSLAMLLVLYSLGERTSLLVVMTAFGIVLVTSTFNVLPGGGGTVEAMLVITLQQFGVGPAAFTAAAIFRLLNFWLLMPVAAICYRWLMHGRVQEQAALAGD